MIFDLELFRVLDFVLTKNPLFLSKDNEQFFQNKPDLLAHIKQPGAWAIMHNRYFNPMDESKTKFLKELADFYKNTDINTNLIVIDSYDYPDLKNIEKIHFFYFPEYHVYYYPLYESFRILPTTLSKKFLCLNKRGTMFRQILYQAFYHYNLLDVSYFSYLCETECCGKLFSEEVHQSIDHQIRSQISHQWPELNSWVAPDRKFITIGDNEDLAQYQSWADLNGWETFTTDPSWLHDHKLYSTSFCSVVVESCPVDEFINISEKTIRPLCLGHPILVFGSCGTVELLRNLGFDMFDDIIDHKYDLIADPITRLKCFLESVKKLNQLTIEELSIINQEISGRRQNNIDRIKQLHSEMLVKEIEILNKIKDIVNFNSSVPKSMGQ